MKSLIWLVHNRFSVGINRPICRPAALKAAANSFPPWHALTHDRFTSDEMGGLLADLSPYADSLESNSDDARLIKVAEREFGKQSRVPSKWVSEFAQLTTVAQEAWVAARRDSNFKAFQPHLERIVEMRREYANFFAPYNHIYDPLLDDYEPGPENRGCDRDLQ